MTVHIPPPLRATANPAPPRRLGSVRRTTSLDVAWPEGAAGRRLLIGRSRDLLTAADGSTRVIEQAQMEAELAFDRTITAISAVPHPARLGELVGEKGGGHLRLVLRETLPELVASGSPLYLLLDDISGTSLVSNWAWSQWDQSWHEKVEQFVPAEQLSKLRDRAGVCWGLKPGSSGLEFERSPLNTPNAEGGSLRNPIDPEGWHEFPELAGVSMRRARRIECWLEPAPGGRQVLRIEAAFQDSAPRPEGGRAALHEYVIRASADPASLELLTLEPEPRVLPFGECPGAIRNALGLVGQPLPRIREAVLEHLRAERGCTHLNDALRSMGEVPHLLGLLA